MYGKKISIDATRLDRPLDPINEMQYSNGMLLFDGISADMTAAVMVLRIGTDATPVVLSIDLAADSIKIPAAANETAGNGLYWIYGFAGTEIYALGYGTYSVAAAPTLAAGGSVTALSNAVWIYNPTTKLYHKVTASQNEDGNVSMDVDQNGVAQP